MPTPKAKREATLQTLREFYDFKSPAYGLDGSPHEYHHVERIKELMKIIQDEQLNKNVPTWRDTCIKLRDKWNFTYQDLAEILNVTHKAIQKQEKTTDVDLFYLEAYSLIYGHSPFVLLQKSPPEKYIEAATETERFHKLQEFASRCISTAEDQFSGYYNIILGFLYDESSPEKIERLKIITKIGELHAYNYLILYDSFKKFQILERIDAIDPSASPECHNDSWRKTWYRVAPLSKEQRKTPEYELLYTFWEAYLLLEDLRERKPTRIKDLAKLALVDDDIMVYLKAVMINIGYPVSPRGHHRYNVDALVCK